VVDYSTIKQKKMKQETMDWRVMERRVRRRQLLVEVIVFLCVLLFVYAGSSKLIATDKFLAQIRNAPYIGPYAPVVVYAIPILEWVIALLLLWPRTRLWGFRLFTGLMVVFTVYIGLIITVAPHIPCSCGGVLEQLGWGDHLVLNLIYIGLGVWGIRMWKRLWMNQQMWKG
jgi:hypothetical protein